MRCDLLVKILPWGGIHDVYVLKRNTSEVTAHDNRNYKEKHDDFIQGEIEKNDLKIKYTY